jgi:hypothetical protein
VDKKLTDEWKKLNNVLIGTTKGGKNNQLINFTSEGKTISVKCFGDVAAGDAIAFKSDDKQWYVYKEQPTQVNRQFLANRQYRKTKLNKQLVPQSSVPILFTKKAPPDLWRLYIRYVGGTYFDFRADCSILESVFYVEVPQGVEPTFYLYSTLWQPYGYSVSVFKPDPFDSPVPVPFENCEKVDPFVLRVNYPSDYLNGGNGNAIVLPRYSSSGIFGTAFESLISFSLLGSGVDEISGDAWDDPEQTICSARVLETRITKSSPEEYNLENQLIDLPYTPRSFTHQYFIGGDSEEPLDLEIKTFSSGIGYLSTTEEARIVSIPYAEYNTSVGENKRLVTLRIDADNVIDKVTTPPYTNAEDDFRKSLTQHLTSGAAPSSGNVCIDSYRDQNVNIIEDVAYGANIPQSIKTADFTATVSARKLVQNSSICSFGELVDSKEVEVFKLTNSPAEAANITIQSFAPIIKSD